MNVPFLVDELRVNLLNTAFCELGADWNYSNVVSPFSRIYLITSGNGYLLPNHVMHQLKPGFLYLVPSYTFCSYHCVDSLSQHYIHFTNNLPDGLKIFDYISVCNEVKAHENDYYLFRRLMELNPDAELQQSDPAIYEKKNWTKNPQTYSDIGKQLETAGILKQILSRFILLTDPDITTIQSQITLRKVFNYINLNLHNEIRIEDLADIACFSTDHFTRQFKKLTSLLPLEYINTKRVEKAQILLLTTTLTQTEIAEITGFNSPQYFNQIFTKYTGSPPARYRKQGGLI